MSGERIDQRRWGRVELAGRAANGHREGTGSDERRQRQPVGWEGRGAPGRERRRGGGGGAGGHVPPAPPSLPPSLPERSDVGGGEGGLSGGLWDRGSQHVRAAGGARSAQAGGDCGRRRPARGGPCLRLSQASPLHTHTHPGRALPGRLGPGRRGTPAFVRRQVEGSGPAVGHGRERVVSAPRRAESGGKGPRSRAGPERACYRAAGPACLPWEAGAGSAGLLRGAGGAAGRACCVCVPGERACGAQARPPPPPAGRETRAGGRTDTASRRGSRGRRMGEGRRGSGGEVKPPPRQSPPHPGAAGDGGRWARPLCATAGRAGAAARGPAAQAPHAARCLWGWGAGGPGPVRV